MTLYDLEGRLVAVNDSWTDAAVSDPGAPAWVSAPALAGKAPVDGEEISEAEARRRFPKADLAAALVEG